MGDWETISTNDYGTFCPSELADIAAANIAARRRMLAHFCRNPQVVFSEPVTTENSPDVALVVAPTPKTLGDS